MTNQAYTDFKNLYLKDIMEIIEKQRSNFPDTKVHSYSHVARCLIIVHALAELHDLSYDDEMRCLIAIGLHDSAREGDKKDLWEAQSARLAMGYCSDKGLPIDFQEEVFALITEKTDVNILPTKNMIVCHDADCLDILRVFGVEKFNPYHFISLREDKIKRTALFLDVRRLIDLTIGEPEFDNKDSLSTMEDNMKTLWKYEFNLFGKTITKK